MAGERHGRSMGTAWYVWISLYSSAITRVSLTQIACNASDENVKAVLYAHVACYVIAETSVKIQGWMTGQIFFLIWPYFYYNDFV
jgi:hypothetical protein